MQDIDLHKERIKAKIIKQIRQEENGCWTWLGGNVRNSSRSDTKYGYFELEGHRVSVRRVVYDVFGLSPKLGDYQIKNTCGNNNCINPSHLVRSDRKKSKGPPRGKRK